MTRGDIVGALKSYATGKGWHFIFGNDQYVSADRHDYLPNEIVMTCLFNPPIPTFAEYSSAVQSYSYTGSIMIGRKFEEITEIIDDEPVVVSKTMAELDETMGQKYDRRLLELSTFAINEMGAFACSNQLQLIVTSSEFVQNIMSDNIDFVLYNVTFTE